MIFFTNKSKIIPVYYFRAPMDTNKQLEKYKLQSKLFKYAFVIKTEKDCISFYEFLLHLNENILYKSVELVTLIEKLTPYLLEIKYQQNQLNVYKLIGLIEEPINSILDTNPDLYTKIFEYFEIQFLCIDLVEKIKQLQHHAELELFLKYVDKLNEIYPHYTENNYIKIFRCEIYYYLNSNKQMWIRLKNIEKYITNITWSIKTMNNLEILKNIYNFFL